MTRKQKREAKQASFPQPGDPISFTAVCNIRETEVAVLFDDKDFSDLVRGIMRLPASAKDCIEALKKLKETYDSFWDIEDFNELCENEFEYNGDAQQEMAARITFALNYGQGISLHTQMRLELLQVFLYFIIPDMPATGGFDMCCDKWIDAMENGDD